VYGTRIKLNKYHNTKVNKLKWKEMDLYFKNRDLIYMIFLIGCFLCFMVFSSN